MRELVYGAPKINYNAAIAPAYPGEEYDSDSIKSDYPTDLLDEERTHQRGGNGELDLSIDPDSVLALDGLDLYTQKIRQIPRLKDKEEAHALARRIERGDLAAKNRLIEANLRLAHAWARHAIYKDRGLDLADLVQAATLGLIRAVEKYDWREGTEFSTYATIWIDQEIERTLAKIGRAVRLPTDKYKMHRKVVAVNNKLFQKGQTSLDALYEEVASETGMSAEEVRDTLSTWYNQQPDSLDRPLSVYSQQDDITLGDLVLIYDDKEAEDTSPTSHAPDLRNALNALPELDRNIVVISFGIETVEVSAPAAAKVRSLHPDTIRKHRKASLEKLQQSRELRQALGIDPPEFLEEDKAA